MSRVQCDARNQRERDVGDAMPACPEHRLLLHGRDQIPIERAAEERGVVRAGIGNDANVEPLRRRRAVPIRRIAFVHEPFAAFPRNEAIRTITHRRTAERRAIEARFVREQMRRQHVLRCRAVTEQRRDRRRPRRFEHDPHGFVVDAFGVRNAVVAFARADRVARIDDRAQREEHVARRDGHAVLPTHAAAQAIGDRASVAREIAVGDGGDAREQDGYGASVRIDIDKRLEREPGKLLLDAVGVRVREERIEGLRIGGNGEAHAGCRPGGIAGSGTGRCRQQQRDSKPAESGDHPAGGFPRGAEALRGRPATVGRSGRFQGFGLMIELATPPPGQSPAAPPASFEHRRLRDGTFWQAIPRYAGVDEATFLDHLWQGRNSVKTPDELFATIEGLVDDAFIADAREGFELAPMAVRVSPYLIAAIDWSHPYDDRSAASSSRYARPRAPTIPA